MIDCYQAINSPEFFAENGDCGLVQHDLKVEGGALSADESSVISAILIQLNSDQISNGERGFWGDQFVGFPVGTRLWTLEGVANIENSALKADEMIRRSLEPLITQGLIDEVRVRAVRTRDGVDAEVDVIKNNISIFSTVL